MLLEKLAYVQHAIWSHWMQYMFTQGTFNEDGSWTMPAEKVNHWQRQMSTNYDSLTKKEQASDLDQAEKVIEVIRACDYGPIPTAY